MPIVSNVVVGLQHGDEGKGKVINYLAEAETYHMSIRFGGGPNAGHTIYKNGVKLVTHGIPNAITEGLICIIGPGCVVDLNKLELEIQYLEKHGINVRDNLKISYNAHIITPQCIQGDIKSDKVGTTKCGIGPTYSRKMKRTGQRVIDLMDTKYTSDDITYEYGIRGEILGCNVVDSFKYIQYIEKSYENRGEILKILFEGAQGFDLDIDWGDYPYVTSSSCLTYQIFSTGVPISSLGTVYGVSKIYDTYVGSKKFMPPNENNLIKLQKTGCEYGSTTNRPRQCNWINLSNLQRSIQLNNVKILIINKCDILEKLGVYKLYNNNEELEVFTDFQEFLQKIETSLSNLGLQDIIFSYSPETV